METSIASFELYLLRRRKELKIAQLEIPYEADPEIATRSVCAIMKQCLVYNLMISFIQAKWSQNVSCFCTYQCPHSHICLLLWTPEKFLQTNPANPMTCSLIGISLPTSYRVLLYFSRLGKDHTLPWVRILIGQAIQRDLQEIFWQATGGCLQMWAALHPGVSEIWLRDRWLHRQTSSDPESTQDICILAWGLE